MVRLPLMSREALDSRADVPGSGSELRSHVDHAKLIERQKERTRAVGALKSRSEERGIERTIRATRRCDGSHEPVDHICHCLPRLPICRERVRDALIHGPSANTIGRSIISLCRES